MSYRTVKKLLGETSLERKCRFLFGGGLMLLITGSFYCYARLNANVVYHQNRSMGRMLVSPIIQETHSTHFKNNDKPDPLKPGDKSGNEQERQDNGKPDNERPTRGKSATPPKPDDLREYRWHWTSADPTRAAPIYRPTADIGYEALEKIRRGKTEVVDIDHAGGEYHFFGAVTAEQSCVACHRQWTPDLKQGDLMGMLQITFPLERTEEALAWNNAILLATAIVTAFLAMLAAYVIVRYVIVKPVQHLKDVADQIAHGTLDLRADIRTGDEFEELSNAFNRMLRHLTTVQDELREANNFLEHQKDELAQANLSLYEMNSLKDGFLATMSHELRTPLNSVLGFSDVLARANNLTDKQKRFVGNIQKSGKDLMALINDLLDLAKIESGKMEIQAHDFLVSDVIERQVSVLMPLAEQKNIEVTILVDEDLPKVQQDSGKLQQILNNLLSNAIKFTPEGGRVRVTGRLADDDDIPRFEIVVEDTGIGIPLEDQDTIFEKFRQGRAAPGQRDTMTREYGGTGLGLSIVKELGRLLGGEVVLESEFGKGSAFTVRLPICYVDDGQTTVGDPLVDAAFTTRPPARGKSGPRATSSSKADIRGTDTHQADEDAA